MGKKNKLILVRRELEKHEILRLGILSKKTPFIINDKFLIKSMVRRNFL